MAQSPSASAHTRIVATPGFLYACVMVMGAIGACLRYLLGALLPTTPLPFGTLAINLIGCYAIYVVYRWFGRRVHMPHAIIRGMGVGLIGAFTTLSAFSTESLAYLQNGSYAVFAMYLLLTMVGTFAASLLGWVTVAALAKRKMHRLTDQLHHQHGDSPHDSPRQASAPASNANHADLGDQR